MINGPAILDHSAANGVLNLDAEKAMRYYTPPSVYLQPTLRPLLADVIQGAADFERAFDPFEALLAARYIIDGGR